MTSYSDPYPGRKGSERIVEPCGKCSGTGLYSGPSGITIWTPTVKDVATGCFDCNGTGRYSFLVSSARATARRRAARQDAAEATREASRAAREAWELAGFAELLEEAETALAGLRHRDPIYYPLATARDTLNLYTATEADAANVRAMLAKIEARKTAPSSLPTGRVEVEGVVRSKKAVETPFGSTLKLLVEADGYKVYGTLPTALYGVEVGARIAFTATVEASRDDAAFGFYKRPTRARLV